MQFVFNQMVIIWWWIFCIIITTVYKSTLVAHLTIPGETKSVNYVSELVDKSDEWTWGYEPLYDAAWTWFKDSSSEDVQFVFKNFEVIF